MTAKQTTARRSKETKPLPPASRERELLEHVRRYRLTTAAALKTLFFADQADSTVRYHTRRLVEADKLASCRLPSGRAYYHFTPQAAREYGAPRSGGVAPGAQALARALGVLAYCCLDTATRLRLTPEELESLYPGLSGPGALTFEDYCLDTDPRDRAFRYLTALKVDAEGAQPDGFLTSIRRQLERGEDIPLFRQLRKEKLFSVAIVTAEPSKRAAFHAAIEKRPLGVPVRVATADIPLYTAGSPE